MAMERPPSDPLGFVQSCHDKAERADIYAMVLHDMKSSLTVILGYSGLLLTDKIGELTSESAELVNGVHKSGLKLLGLIEDLLTISRLDSDQPALDTEETSLEGLLAEAREMFWIAAASKGLDLVVEPCGGLPDVELDRKLVMRALSNLVQNAVAYTPHGGKVTVSAVVHPAPGAGIVLSVRDTGPGIPAEEQAMVFEKYYRSRKTASARGTGLGLAIVKGVAELHGGRVELRSEPGEGCTFSLVLPALKKAA